MELGTGSREENVSNSEVAISECSSFLFSSDFEHRRFIHRSDKEDLIGTDPRVAKKLV
jgi:hypothetical protein